MKNLLLLLLLGLSSMLGAQAARDTSYVIELDGQVFDVQEKIFPDGKATMERTPVTDTTRLLKYWVEKIESVGNNYCRAVSVVLGGESIMADAKKVSVYGISPADTLVKLVLKQRQGDWLLNGSKCHIEGDQLTVGEDTYRCEGICLGWFRLIGEKKRYDFYLLKDGRFIDFRGNTFERPKKNE